MDKSKMKKVLCPVEGKNGKTYWMRVGTGFNNRDGSINLYLDAYPANGKLQIREYDDDYKPANNTNSRVEQASDALPF